MLSFYAKAGQTSPEVSVNGDQGRALEEVGDCGFYPGNPEAVHMGRGSGALHCPGLPGPSGEASPGRRSSSVLAPPPYSFHTAFDFREESCRYSGHPLFILSVSHSGFLVTLTLGLRSPFCV